MSGPPPDPALSQPMPTELSLVPAATAPFAFPKPADDVDFNATPPMPIDPGGNPTTLVVHPATVIPGEPLSKTGGNNPYALSLPTLAFMPLVQGVKFNLSAHPPWKTAGIAEPATPPPLLTMTRTPPFPAYPS